MRHRACAHLPARATPPQLADAAPTVPQTALAQGGATPEQLRQLVHDIATASRNLVKNQVTWFRDDAMFRCAAAVCIACAAAATAALPQPLPGSLLSVACRMRADSAACIAAPRWLELGGRSGDEVLDELLAELGKEAHEGGCGDSGRLDKAAQQALKRYVPTLQLLADDARAAEVLEWVAAAVAKRRHGGAASAAAAAVVPPAHEAA